MYELYKDVILNEWSFWNIYYGNRYKLIMPEVFTEENRKKHTSLANSGENNGRAKMNVEDVKEMRRLKEEGLSNKEIQDLYPQYSHASINTLLRFETWKNI